ncbi:unnamed protein product [Malus baccata var. baccata]
MSLIERPELVKDLVKTEDYVFHCSSLIISSHSKIFELIGTAYLVIKGHRRDEISSTAPSSNRQGFQKRFKGILAQKIDRAPPSKICRKWIKNRLNMALLLWIVCVAVSGAILFLVMTGILNHVLPTQSQRNEWHEINNQILNALFTLMSLYHHLKRIYCKDGTYKPNEQLNIMVVVVLLHLDCFAQYSLCTLNLGYKRSERPAIGVGVCLSVAIAAPAIAGVYCIASSLGTEYEVDRKSQDHILTNRTFASRNEQKIAEFEPQWRGVYLIFKMILQHHIFLFSAPFVFSGGTPIGLDLATCMCTLQHFSSSAQPHFGSSVWLPPISTTKLQEKP